MSTGNAFAQVNERVAQAGEYLDLPKGLVQAISSCEREVVISIPLPHLPCILGVIVRS
jgi:glutamate dehydrogenase (NAD(P)+)